MMEEVSDDTNGESSFEFVSRKIEENTLKDDSPPLAATEQLISPPFTSTFAPSVNPSSFTASVSNLTTSTLPVLSQKTESSIKFYDVDPKSSQSVMLPPPINPGGNLQFSSSIQPGAQSPLPPVQSNYSLKTAASDTFQTPLQQQPAYTAPIQQPYYPSPSQHSALSLPVEPAGVTPEYQSEVGVWGWLKGKDFLNKVAEKAKSSVDSVITTLDPGMKEIINSGGDIHVVVASGNEDKISAIREAFQLVFGKATVQGIAVQSSSIAPQPVGFSAGLKAAEERISNLKQMASTQAKPILLSVENFLTELTPDNWFDMGCLLLQDQSSGINLQVYTEAIPISSQYVALAKDQTPVDYPLGWSGFAVTIGHIMGSALGVHHSQWHQALTGISRREILFLAAKTIAGLYKSQTGR